MSIFPLYDSLNKHIQHNKDFSDKQRKDFLSKISKMDTDGYELIYALICYDSIVKGNPDKVPYKGVKHQNGITWELNYLPHGLKRILLKFMNIHLVKMKEERVRLDSGS